jgi:hypothetical protein
MALKWTTVIFVILVAGTPNFDGIVSADSLNNRIRQVGSYRPAKVDAADVVRMAKFATSVISASNYGNIKLIKILKAWKQVVAGTNYKLILELFNTYTGKVVPCKVIVFDQPWTNTRELTSSSCFRKREKRQIPGGYVPRDVNDSALYEKCPLF